MTFIIVFIILLLWTSSNINFTLLRFLFFLLTLRLKIRLLNFYGWLTYLIVIFLLGGLIVSFVYINNISPNWNSFINTFFLFLFFFIRGVMRIFFLEILSNFQIKIFYLNELFFIYRNFYLFLAFPLFIFLLFILLYVEKSLRFFKGNLR